MGSHASARRPAAPSDDSRILDALRRIVRALRESSRAAEARLGMSSAQLFVLQVLAQHPGIGVNELAGHTRTHQSSVSVVVTRLVERGLVARERSETDARRLELQLTGKGRALLRKAPITAQEQLVATLHALPPTQRRQLARALDAVVVGMALEAGPAAMFFEDDAAPRARRGGRSRAAPRRSESK